MDPARQPAARVGAGRAWKVADAQCAWWRAGPTTTRPRSPAELFDAAAWARARAIAARPRSTRVDRALDAADDGDARRRVRRRRGRARARPRRSAAPGRARADATRPGDALRDAYRDVPDGVLERAARRGSGALTLGSRSVTARTVPDASSSPTRPSCCPTSVELRRRIHRTPELGLELPQTQAAVLDALDGLGLDVRTGDGGVVGRRRPRGGARRARSILLRGDMDALPMPEDTGLEFASEVDGAMHACGHDAHTAMLVGAARLLHARRARAAGHGALHVPARRRRLPRRALHDRRGRARRRPPVDAAFALHVSPNLPSGSIWTRGGPLMASADVLEIKVTGKGGHASTPYLANDPMPVAAEIVQALQVMVTRRINTFDPVVDHDHEDPRRHDRQRDPRDGRHARHAARGVGARVARLAIEAIEQLVEGIAQRARACAPS